MRKSFLLTVLISIFLVCFLVLNKTIKNIIADKNSVNLFINGVEVQSYNIDGKTLVLLDDITEHYGKYVGFYQGSHPKANISNRKYKVFAHDNLVSKSEHKKKNQNAKPKNQIKKMNDNGVCIYNKEIPAYDIDGKTAVAVEDLGDDQRFSDIGGKYIIDKKANKIDLELMHDNRKLLSERKMDLDLKSNDEQTKILAIAKRENLNPGMINYLNFKDFDLSKKTSLIIPIFTQINNKETQIGYYFASWCWYDQPQLGGNELLTRNYQFAYFNNVDAFDELNKLLPTTLDAYKEIALGGSMHLPGIYLYEDFISTSDYAFYNYRDYMIRVDNKSGTWHNYAQDFSEEHKINGVNIDEAKEQVYITFDADKHAVIDLKTGRLKIN